MEDDFEQPTGDLTLADLYDAWPVLSKEERVEGFGLLRRDQTAAEQLFLEADSELQAEILFSLPTVERRAWFRLLPPDDAADVIQRVPDKRDELLALLEEVPRNEVMALLAYAEDDAGGLMNPHFARVRPDMRIDEALRYLRRQTRDQLGGAPYVYVLDSDQRLLGVTSFRRLFFSAQDKAVRDAMATDPVTVPELMDQEAVSRLFAKHNFLAIPVVDPDGRMKGVVTVDDIVDVVQEEATEDAQKFGGMAALEEPYMAVPFGTMLKKRAGWLAALFVGEMLTASAMGYFEHEIARAVVLALFVPLIISSGGNSGSQASTLVIRAMALGQLRLRDFARVARRELASGLVLGLILAAIGLVRVFVWQRMFGVYGEHWFEIGLSVGISLIGVVTIGTLAGSMLPFLLRRIGIDPASASAPFVATLVDVAGLLIYFSVAATLLHDALL